MKNDTTLTIRTNKELKDKAQELFRELGMDTSTAVNVFLRQAVRENRIPFEVTRDIPAPERPPELDFLETEVKA